MAVKVTDPELGDGDRRAEPAPAGVRLTLKVNGRAVKGFADRQYEADVTVPPADAIPLIRAFRALAEKHAG